MKRQYWHVLSFGKSFFYRRILDSKKEFKCSSKWRVTPKILILSNKTSEQCSFMYNNCLVPELFHTVRLWVHPESIAIN
jgi:hypothetical protein